MKVILLRDVARLGRKGTVADVPTGYAMNQLIPSKSAAPATPENLKKAEQSLKDKAAQVEANEAAFNEATAKIDSAGDLTVTATANDQGHLFKAVSADDVVKMLKEKEVNTDLFLVSFKEPVKEVGEHQVILSHAGHTHTITINVAAA